MGGLSDLRLSTGRRIGDWELCFSSRGGSEEMATEENRQFFGCSFHEPSLPERHWHCERININMCSNDWIEWVASVARKCCFCLNFLFIIYARCRTCKVYYFLLTIFFSNPGWKTAYSLDGTRNASLVRRSNGWRQGEDYVSFTMQREMLFRTKIHSSRPRVEENRQFSSLLARLPTSAESSWRDSVSFGIW